MQNRHRKIRAGFTLLEMAVAAAMLSMLVTSCMVLVGTSYDAWNRHEEDHSSRQSGLAVLRHITRHIRQAKSVASISSASDTSGTISILDTDGQLLVWSHDAGSKEVLYGVGSATSVLATGIEELSFQGIRRNGWEATTTPGLIYSVQCTTKVSLAHPAGADTVTSSCQAWLRAW